MCRAKEKKKKAEAALPVSAQESTLPSMHTSVAKAGVRNVREM